MTDSSQTGTQAEAAQAPQPSLAEAMTALEAAWDTWIAASAGSRRQLTCRRVVSGNGSPSGGY